MLHLMTCSGTAFSEMALTLAFLIVVVAFSSARGLSTDDEHSSTLKDARLEYLSKWNSIAERYREDPDVKKAVEYASWYHKQMNSGKLVDDRPPAIDIPSYPFTCNPQFGKSATMPTSVHALRPGDITVIASFGDSMTAGNGLGAVNALEVIRQNRGESWCIGGDYTLEMNVTSLPNMLRKFNPNVKGHSDCYGTENSEYSWFNMAVPGARATHMPEQAEDMVYKMKNDPRVVYAEDWKMVTLFIGANDMCSYCDNKDSRSPENFKMHIQNALDILHAQVPRVFVNLVPMIDVAFIQNVTFHHPNTSYPDDPDPARLYPILCDIAHIVFCKCVLTHDDRTEMKQVQMAYFDVMQELVDSGRYDTKDDFTVVLQPFLRDAEAAKDPNTGLTDNRYFAPDCFHPNRRMHQVMAHGLWNTMLTKVGEKPYRTGPDLWDYYKCPTEETPYLYTTSNSVPPTPPTSTGAEIHGRATMAKALVVAVILGIKTYL